MVVIFVFSRDLQHSILRLKVQQLWHYLGLGMEWNMSFRPKAQRCDQKGHSAQTEREKNKINKIEQEKICSVRRHNTFSTHYLSEKPL